MRRARVGTRSVAPPDSLSIACLPPIRVMYEGWGGFRDPRGSPQSPPVAPAHYDWPFPLPLCKPPPLQMAHTHIHTRFSATGRPNRSVRTSPNVVLDHLRCPNLCPKPTLKPDWAVSTPHIYQKPLHVGLCFRLGVWAVRAQAQDSVKNHSAVY